MIEINVSKITKSFGFKNILNELSFEVKTGEVVSIIGENGCGKTTLIKHIMDNSEDNIKLDTNIKIGYIPQQITEYVGNYDYFILK